MGWEMLNEAVEIELFGLSIELRCDALMWKYGERSCHFTGSGK